MKKRRSAAAWERLVDEWRSGVDDWKVWLEAKKPEHPPKSPMGRAVRYSLNQWDCLTAHLDDPKLRLDNNISEGALRIIALGRDNFRWVELPTRPELPFFGKNGWVELPTRPELPFFGRNG